MSCQKSYKFRIYPNAEQEVLIRRTFGCCRYVYNHFLARRKEYYEQTGKTLGVFACSKELTALKQAEETKWLQEPDKNALQYALRHLDAAYQNFFRRVKRGETPGYPKFKSKHDRHQSYRTTGPGIKVWDGSVQLPKLGRVRCRGLRPVQGRILAATVSCTPSGKYFVSLSCTEVEIDPLPSTGSAVGLDLGLKVLATASDGTQYESPKHLANSLKKLARLQRQFSRKTKGSRNWEKARLRVASLHEHIANQRADSLHKLTTTLIRQHDIICVEDLQAKTADTDTATFIRHRVNRTLADASWGELHRQLAYKAAWYGKQLVTVGKDFPSSQLCSSCGTQWSGTKDLSVRQWSCPGCGAVHHRDLNAAKNILAEGLRLLA